MKNIFCFLVSLAMILGWNLGRADDAKEHSYNSCPNPSEVQKSSEDIMPDKIFVPPGFDDNDTVQIVVDMTFKSTRYGFGGITYRRDPGTNNIYVRTKASINNEMCFDTQVLESYFESVKLIFDEQKNSRSKTIPVTTLDAGKYNIFVEREGSEPVLKTTFSVAKAEKQEKDNYSYIPANDFHVVPLPLGINNKYAAEQSTQSYKILLTGMYHPNCFVPRFNDDKKENFQAVRVHKDIKVIEVLPRVEFLKKDCSGEKKVPFNEEIELSSVPPGRYLIHVRVRNGEAKNKVEDL